MGIFQIEYYSKHYLFIMKANKTNSVALVRERTIPTERTLLAGKVSANYCG
jgi:hypothetical protein